MRALQIGELPKFTSTYKQQLNFFMSAGLCFLRGGLFLQQKWRPYLFAGSEVYHKLRDRAKLGTTAASSVPIVLIGKNQPDLMLLGDGLSSQRRTVDSLGHSHSQNLTTQRTTQPYLSIWCMSRKKPDKKL